VCLTTICEDLLIVGVFCKKRGWDIFAKGIPFRVANEVDEVIAAFGYTYFILDLNKFPMFTKKILSVPDSLLVDNSWTAQREMKR